LARRALSLAVLLIASTALCADDPVRVRFGWSKPRDCRREARIERGRLRHVGKNPIRDVTVCFGRECKSVAGGAVIAGGATVPVPVEDARGSTTIRCSVLEERAGA